MVHASPFTAGPGAVGPKQTEDFARRYFEIDAFDGLQAGIGFAETPDRDRTGAGHAGPGRFAVTLYSAMAAAAMAMKALRSVETSGCCTRKTPTRSFFGSTHP